MDLFDNSDENEIFDDGEKLELSNDAVEKNQEENDNDDAQEEEKKVVKPKRVTKNPRVVLNAELLKGPKGLGNLERCFERVQFKGKGYEEQDLNVLLKTYEYWCHRLFPKFPFKDCIDKIEKLGSKGPIQTYLKKARSGLEDEEFETPDVLPDFKSDEENEPGSSNAFQFSSQTSIADIPIELTEEQLETIRRNREKAEKLRQERLRRIQEKASVNLPEKHQINQASTSATTISSIEVNGENCLSNDQFGSNANDDKFDAEDCHNIKLQGGQVADNPEEKNVDSDSDGEIQCLKKQSKKIFDEDEEEEIITDTERVNEGDQSSNLAKSDDEMEVDQ
ncbi:TIMELESS-interacting protein [Coccinella septempunctata]|uniref:TIMELESS-interacting protein n=1 Tax=Coccinella septempunctata TaxID=41139 RepID=UPI001D05F5BE|nr:TIMELESS-interacting protein [Coccinella septempunctata]